MLIALIDLAPSADRRSVRQERFWFLHERDDARYETLAADVGVGQILADGERTKAEIRRDRAVRMTLEPARHALERFVFQGDLQTVARERLEHGLKFLRVLGHRSAPALEPIFVQLVECDRHERVLRLDVDIDAA